MANFKNINYAGFVFPVQIRKDGKPGKFERDLLAVAAILDKGTLDHAARLDLLRYYNVAYHESGKIEGIFSLDSSATNNAFCVKMRKAAENNPEIICGNCYDFAQERYKLNALARHTLNMLIMQSVEFTIDELATLPGNGEVRVNSSGDAANNVYAENMIKYAMAHESANVAIWTKNKAVYIAACDKYGKPANVTLIYSSPLIGKAAELPKYFDYVFTVYFDKAATENAIANGAAECNGKRCRACGFKCYHKGWQGKTNIAELLRK